MAERLTIRSQYDRIGNGNIAHKKCRDTCTTRMNCSTCELELQMLDRLAELEDAEEQRNKGCEYCNEKRNMVDPYADVDKVEIYYNNPVKKTYMALWIGDGCVGNYPITHCFHCGRKLKEAE